MHDISSVSDLIGLCADSKALALPSFSLISPEAMLERPPGTPSCVCMLNCSDSRSTVRHFNAGSPATLLLPDCRPPLAARCACRPASSMIQWTGPENSLGPATERWSTFRLPAVRQGCNCVISLVTDDMRYDGAGLEDFPHRKGYLMRYPGLLTLDDQRAKTSQFNVAFV